MKTRIRALLLAAMFVVSLLPAMSFAAATQKTATAENLESVIESATGETVVTLTEDATVNSQITISNGATVTLTAAQEVTITGTTYDIFTVTNGTLILGNNIHVVGKSSVLWMEGNGKIIVDGAVVENKTDATFNLVSAVDNGVFEVKTGEVNGKNDRATISVNDDSKAFISGGKVTSAQDGVIGLFDNAQATVSGGEVVSMTKSVIGAEGSGSKAIITGGLVKTESTNEDPKYIAVYCFDGASIEVSGGTIEAVVGYAVATGTTSTNATIAISGGTIKGGTEGDVCNSETNTNGSFTISGGSFSQEIPSDMGITIVPPPVYGGPVMNWVKVNAAENGVVKSGPLAASAGATITLYPKASTGYVLDTVEVLDAEGNAVALDGMKFQVPLGGVTVNATFKLAE